MARSLVDTNILVYSRDLNEPVKRTRAIEVIDQRGAGGELVLSAQCLNEFSSASLRRGTPIASFLKISKTGEKSKACASSILSNTRILIPS